MSTHEQTSTQRAETLQSVEEAIDRLVAQFGAERILSIGQAIGQKNIGLHTTSKNRFDEIQKSGSLKPMTILQNVVVWGKYDPILQGLLKEARDEKREPFWRKTADEQQHKEVLARKILWQLHRGLDRTLAFRQADESVLIVMSLDETNLHWITPYPDVTGIYMQGRAEVPNANMLFYVPVGSGFKDTRSVFAFRREESYKFLRALFSEQPNAINRTILTAA